MSWSRPRVRAADAVTPLVHQDQLEAGGDARPVQVRQHQLAGPVLVG